METPEYETLFQLEDTYWWYVARRELVQEWLEKLYKTPHSQKTKLLLADVGCGTGATERVLVKFGDVVLLDRSQQALRFCQKRVLARLVASSAESIALRSETVNVVTALDILEHLDNDVEGLKEIERVLVPGGVLLLTVPAFGFLWSEHDEALHHRRRYTSYELRNKLSVAGFDVERSTYFITLLFVPIALVRLWQGIVKTNAYPKTSHVILPRWLNTLLEELLRLERVLCRWVNLPLGVSIIAVARKPGVTPSVEGGSR